MKGSSHLKTAVVSAFVGAIAATGTVALAGTGVGGIFNLGQANTVDATSSLSGASTGAQLQVTNSGTGTAAQGIAAFNNSAAATLYGRNSGTGPAVSGRADKKNNGVEGVSAGSGASGVFGANTSADGFGVAGRSTGASGIGVFGNNTGGGWAGWFTGKLHLGGALDCSGCVSAGNITGKVNDSDLLDGLDSSGFLKPSSVASGDVSGPYTDLQLAPNSVDSAEIATDAVKATEIANDSIDSGEIVDFGLSNQDVGVLFAQVNADGTIANSSGGVTGVHIGTGTYEVDFGHTISGCAFVMTQGESGAGGASGGITGATDRSGNAEAVFATVRTNANALVDRAFQLVVVC
jgi:hypothetical protein